MKNFYSMRTRAKGNSCEIAEIDAISNNANSATRATNDNPHNLLYIVRMSDGSTVIVGGDKRAEPVYAHFDNLNLKINEKGEFVGKYRSLPRYTLDRMVWSTI